MSEFETSQDGQYKVSVVPDFGTQNKIDTVIWVKHIQNLLSISGFGLELCADFGPNKL